MDRLDQSIWQTIAANSGPFANPTPQFFNLTFPSDRLIITVSSVAAKQDWVRAGYAHYVWVRGDDDFLVSSHLCYLNTSKVCSIEPLATAVIGFEPVAWIKDWQITIEAREL
jgi:hypothetical protein